MTTREDLAAEVRASLDAAVPVMVGEQKKPARAPRATTGFLVVNADWDPAAYPAAAWSLIPFEGKPGRKAALQEARAEQSRFQAMAPNEPPKAILEVTATYQVVEDGGRG